jgi:hypothetical protein
MKKSSPHRISTELTSEKINKDKAIENLEKEIKLVKEVYIDRSTFKNLESEVVQIKDHLKQTDKKIEECKLI